MNTNKIFIPLFTLMKIACASSPATPALLSYASSWDNISIPPEDEPSAWIMVERELSPVPKKVELPVHEKFKVGSKQNIFFFFNFVMHNNFSLTPCEVKNLFSFVFPFLEVNLPYEMDSIKKNISKRLLTSVFQSALANYAISINYSFDEQRLAQKTYSYMIRSYKKQQS